MKRTFLLSLAGAALVVLPFIVLALLVVFGPVSNPRELDDAPMRAAGIIFFLSPVVFAVLTIVFFSGGTAVRWVRNHRAPVK
jgi:hypothetical protein